MLKRIANLPRIVKSLVILAADAALLPLALWTAYTLSLHDALPIYTLSEERRVGKECKIGRAHV